MISREKLTLWGLPLLSAVLMSIPWLVPHAGAVALVAWVPLLIAEDIASRTGAKRFFFCHYAAFCLWNALTTFWVCNATVGGGLASIFITAAVFSLIFALFRFAKKRLGGGAVPYILLAAAWIAWERWCLTDAQILWPWLVGGNAFALSTRLVQWYEYTGVLGGSLWIWACNLGIFGIISAVSDGSRASRWNAKARAAAAAGITLVILGPVVASALIYSSCEEVCEGQVEAVIAQPNFDPYHKFESMTQAEQNAVLLDLFDKGLAERADSSAPVLLLAPETFTSDVLLPEMGSSPTVQTFRAWLRSRPGAEMLYGASAYEIFTTRSAPSKCAREIGGGWLVSRNCAIMEDGSEGEVYNKSKLVVATELTPYPGLFIPLEKLLCRVFGLRAPLMGRCEGQKQARPLHFRDSIPVGCAVCYESVFGEHCADYVRGGAQAMTVITNDAWWGDTPGYRQHFSYSRLRAIELRRDFARCGNTGISGFIDQRGDVVQSGPWWESCVMRGKVNLSSKQTFFVRHGDVTGRVCTFVFLLLALLLVVRLFVPRS